MELSVRLAPSQSTLGKRDRRESSKEPNLTLPSLLVCVYFPVQVCRSCFLRLSLILIPTRPLCRFFLNHIMICLHGRIEHLLLRQKF